MLKLKVGYERRLHVNWVVSCSEKEIEKHLGADARPRNSVFKNHQHIGVTELGSQVQGSHTVLAQTIALLYTNNNTSLQQV